MQINTSFNPVNTISIGGVTLSTSGLIILKAVLTSGSWSPFYNVTPGTTPAVYQPSGSYAFYGRAIRWHQFSAVSTSNQAAIYYADNNPGIMSGVTPTNPVGFTSGVTSVLFNSSTEYFIGANYYTTAPLEIAVGGKMANGKYLHLTSGGAFGACLLYGYEA